MRTANRLSKSAAILAMIMALIAFLLGSAPFTPALVLGAAALPLAVACIFFGAWRLSTLAIYWATAAFLAVPLASSMAIRVDYVLATLGAVGVVLSTVLYGSYRQVATP